MSNFLAIVGKRSGMSNETFTLRGSYPSTGKSRQPSIDLPRAAQRSFGYSLTGRIINRGCRFIMPSPTECLSRSNFFFENLSQTRWLSRLIGMNDLEKQP